MLKSNKILLQKSTSKKSNPDKEGSKYFEQESFCYPHNKSKEFFKRMDQKR